MQRQSCSLGCILLGLGALLSCCLLPYLVSSIYSIVTAVLQVEAAPDWLWGELLNSLVGGSDALYMILAEGPVCCVGALGLLIVILGLVLAVSGFGQVEEETYPEETYLEEDYIPYSEPEDRYPGEY